MVEASGALEEVTGDDPAGEMDLFGALEVAGAFDGVAGDGVDGDEAAPGLIEEMGADAFDDSPEPLLQAAVTSTRATDPARSPRPVMPAMMDLSARRLIV